MEKVEKSVRLAKIMIYQIESLSGYLPAFLDLPKTLQTNCTKITIIIKTSNVDELSTLSPLSKLVEGRRVKPSRLSQISSFLHSRFENISYPESSLQIKI